MPPKEAMRDDKAAAVIQAQMRGKNARSTGAGAEAAAAAEKAGAAAAGGKKSKEAAKAAAEAAERQQLAEATFVEADADGSGFVDEEELTKLLSTMLAKQSISFEKSALAEFVAKEFAVADIDGDGQVDFDEFVQYYNSFIDRIEKNQLAEAMKEAAKAAAVKEEELAAAEDGDTYKDLMTLLGILRNPSVKAYTGIHIPFTSTREARSDGSSVLPEPMWGFTSRGIILDLSRQAQRILTPWGGLSLGYRLSFPGYQEKAKPEPAPDDKKKPRKANTAWPAIDAGESEGEEHPLFFELCKYRRSILGVTKLPNRCHFRIVELNSRSCPKGEVCAASKETDPARIKKLQERYQAVLKLFSKDPPPGLPEEDGPTGAPLLNLLAERCLAPRLDKLDLLKKKAAGGRTKWTDEDILRGLLLGNNDLEAGHKSLQNMKRGEDNLVSKRGGHATRAQVRYALQTCNFDEELSEYMLTHDKELARSVAFIKERLGTQTGLGYPTTADLQRLLVQAKGNEGVVMAGLKKSNRMEVEMMADIIAAAEVEEMLTPERCDAFGIPRQPSAEAQKHIEDAYLYKFDRDQEKVIQYFTQAGTVMRRSVGTPERSEVEMLLDELGGQADPVIQFLQALQNMCDVASKKGNPHREDCARYLRTCGRDEESAIKFMDTIHKMSNPKPPKPPAKGSKKPPQPHLAAQCGFPSRAEAEWGLRTALLELTRPGARKAASTRSEDKEGKPLNVDKALELLSRLHAFDDERQANPEKYGQVGRPDIVWSLDPERTERFVKIRPLSHEEYTSGQSPASILLAQIGSLIAVSQGIEGGSYISDAVRHEVWDAIEKFEFNAELAQKYITGVKTLMLQQTELSIESREEVDSIMKSQNYDDQRVLILMQNMAELQKNKADLGNPSRTEIKDMLLVAWDDPDRVKTASVCLKTYRLLLMDDGQMMSIFGKPPNEDDKLFIRMSTFRFKGNKPEVESYMKKVSDLLHQGESLGDPTREQVIAVLDEFNLNPREAHRKLRDDYWKIKDAELKEEYRRNRERATAAEKS